MAEHHAPSVERHADVAIIGGSAAGLAAALQLGRQRRSTIVIDAGEPRNAPAAHMHSFLGREGQPPSTLTAAGRDEVRSYGGEVLPGRVVGVERTTDDRFRVELVGGHAVIARRVLLATGIVDELPDIAGVAGHWGQDVIHCPFCHGYEVRDEQIVQIVSHQMGFHPTPLLRTLTERLTVVLHDPALDGAEAERLRQAGIAVVAGPAVRVVDDGGGRVTGVEVAGGVVVPADAVVVGPRFRANVDAVTGLGVDPVDHASGLGTVVQVDDTGATSVAGIYAAGNVTDPSQQVLQAAAHGSRVGAMISFSLANEDLDAAARPSANEADWDRRYEGERLWSGNPNGSLVAEITGMAPGRALDVGAGEGGDALWLAEQGWTVTASDVTRRALDRVAAESIRRGLEVELLHADANGPAPFAPRAYDLVSAHYASIPRTPDDRGVRNLLDAVAPDGTLLVVSHDLEPMRVPVDTSTHSRPFDPDAYVRVEDVARAVTASPEWDVEVHERRPRPVGAASTHHVDDVVFRARRRP
ncbi:MAG: FAD-dependent oxidoreductase [Actinomycetota bacterium]|nr:FAD-dependent oxidoreductase [Actinomycetota bacterium]